MSKLLRNALIQVQARSKHTCTLIPGDGIGPEISEAVKKIFVEAKVREIRYLFHDEKREKKLLASITLAIILLKIEDLILVRENAFGTAKACNLKFWTLKFLPVLLRVNKTSWLTNFSFLWPFCGQAFATNVVSKFW